MTGTGTDIVIPSFGMGMAPIGKKDDADAQGIVDAAWRGGVRYFDTAPLYGGGRSERRAGVALGEFNRADFVLSTKVGAYMDGDTRRFDHGYDTALRSFDDSLERLQLDYVDILYLHDPGERIAEALDGSYRAAEQLRREGRVRAVGAGVNTVEEGLQLVRQSDISVLMLAGRFTLLDRTAERELLPLCAERGVQVVAAGVFNSGILAGRSTTFDYRPADDLTRVRAGALRDLAQRWSVPLGAIAIAFSTSHPAVVSCVVGASAPAQMQECLSWWRTPIPAGLWAELAAHDAFTE